VSSTRTSRARFGEPLYDRVEAPATPAQKELLGDCPRSSSVKDWLARRFRQSSPGAGQRCSHRRAEVVARADGSRRVRRGPRDLQDLRGELHGADHLRRILEEARPSSSDRLWPRPRLRNSPAIFIRGKAGNNPMSKDNGRLPNRSPQRRSRGIRFFGGASPELCVGRGIKTPPRGVAAA